MGILARFVIRKGVRPMRQCPDCCHCCDDICRVTSTVILHTPNYRSRQGSLRGGGNPLSLFDPPLPAPRPTIQINQFESSDFSFNTQLSQTWYHTAWSNTAFLLRGILITLYCGTAKTPLGAWTPLDKHPTQKSWTTSTKSRPARMLPGAKRPEEPVS
jgi:hypothetical protein